MEKPLPYPWQRGLKKGENKGPTFRSGPNSVERGSEDKRRILRDVSNSGGEGGNREDSPSLVPRGGGLSERWNAGMEEMRR